MAVVTLHRQDPGYTSWPSYANASTTKASTVVRRSDCGRPNHDTPWRCPLHGCPQCLLDVVAYDDAPLAPPLYDEGDHDGELLDTLHDAFVFGQGGTCLICSEIVTQAGWARYPGWKCELRGCIHCTLCDLCMDTGRVCRHCWRCPDHELETGAECERSRWSRVLLDNVTYFAHSFYDAATGRWRP